MYKRSRLSRALAGIAAALIAVVLVACGTAKSGTSGAAASSSTASSSSGSTTASQSTAGSAKSLQPYTGSERILVTDAASKSVTINLVGAENNTDDGFNFNGYSRGAMDIEVPTDWKVTINFTVASSVAHSALIVPFGERFSSLLHPAFPGSESPDNRGGITSGHAAQQFTFTVDKAGSYAIVCGVPGHDNLGMWDGFDVVDGLSAPEVLVAR